MAVQTDLYNFEEVGYDAYDDDDDWWMIMMVMMWLHGKTMIESKLFSWSNSSQGWYEGRGGEEEDGWDGKQGDDGWWMIMMVMMWLQSKMMIESK